MYEEWQPVYTALAADVMDGLGRRDQAMEHEIRPALPTTWFAGPAITINAFASDESSDDPYATLFAAYDQMNHGDVIVIATNGELRSGLWGELLATAARGPGSKRRGHRRSRARRAPDE